MREIGQVHLYLASMNHRLLAIYSFSFSVVMV
jgi:hypothetical protein